MEPHLSWALVLCEAGTASCGKLGKTLGLGGSPSSLSGWPDLESHMRLVRHTSRED